MKNKAYKIFLKNNDFYNVEKRYKETYTKKFEESGKGLFFRDFDKKLYKNYFENKSEIIQSYFRNLRNDLLNGRVIVSEYHPIFLLEDGFNTSESSFFANYFLEFLEDLNKAISNGFYDAYFFDFVWNVFDRIFHESYHLEKGLEKQYTSELNKLKSQIEKIDKQDKHLIKQKIEQFIS